MKKIFKVTKWIVLGLLILIVIGLFTQVRRDISIEQIKAKYADSNSRFIDIDGLNVHYRDEGTENSPGVKGIPILLLHGSGSSLQTWDEWVKILSPSHRIIRIDLPGYGMTGPTREKDYSMNWYVGFLEKFLQKISVSSCYLAGNSFGGHIALRYALAHPEHVVKLVLIDSSGYPMEMDGALVFKLARTPVLNNIMRYVTPRSLVEKTIKKSYGDPSKVTQALVDRYFDMILCQGNRETFIAIANKPFDDSSLLIPKIKVETLILWGDKDALIPPAHANRFNYDIPGSKLIMYPGVGHIPMEEIPEQTARDVDSFFHDIVVLRDSMKGKS